MLETLDNVNWAGMRHAYGPATDVPDNIRGLTSKSAKVRKTAWYWLSCNIYHQGSRYRATHAAVPFLLELVEEPSVADRDEILRYLLCLAWGHPGEYLSEVFEPLNWKKADKWSRKAYEAVRDGAETYFELLDDPDPRVRRAAAYVAPWFSDTSKQAAELLAKRLAVEKKQDVKASLLLALGMAAARCRQTGYRDVLLEELKGRSARVHKVCAAVGLVWLDKTAASSQTIDLLKSAAQNQKLRKLRLDWNRGDLAGIAAKMLNAVGGDDAALAMAAGLTKVRDPHQALEQANALLGSLGFTELPSEPVMPEDLSEVQKQALELLVESPAAFHFGNMAGVLQGLGLPCWNDRSLVKADNGRGALRVFLDQVKPGPMDRRIKISSGKAQRRWPLRYCLRGTAPNSLFGWLQDRPPLFSGDELAGAMVSQLAPAASIEAWIAVGQGHDYGFSGPQDKHALVEIALNVMDRYGAKARAPLLKAARALVKERYLQPATATWVIVALGRLAQEAKQPLSPELDSIWVKALSEDPGHAELRELLGQMPRERLEAIFANVHIHHKAREDGSICLWGGWLYFDLCPTAPMMQKVVDHIVNWRENERHQRDLGVKKPAHPRERAVELLVLGGDASIRPLREALSAKKRCKHVDVLEQAFRRLGQSVEAAAKRPAKKAPKKRAQKSRSR